MAGQRREGPGALAVFLNWLRVLVCGAWTALLGLPLLVVIYLRYGYGLLRSQLGRVDVLDRVLEANARLAGWVAQRLWVDVLFAVAGVGLRVRELIPVDWAKAHVICANHTSLFDILALIRAVPPPFRFVAKRELLRWPIIGWALPPAGQIIVDRADQAGAIRSIAEAAMRKIRGQVIFFVEGTRSRTGALQPFKKGAFHFAIDHHLPILPTAIRGAFATLGRVPWWRLATGHVIEICFCRPIEPAGRMVEALSDQTRAAIVAALAEGEAQAAG